MTIPQLNAPSPIGHNRPPRSARLSECHECGTPFPARAGNLFCAPACRRDYNNRRQMRGAEVYDLVMIMRYERGIAKALGIWKILCRMAARFRAEDEALRAGRKSWRPARVILERHPDLQAVATNIRPRRKP